MSRLVACVAALLLVAGVACTSPHHRADLVRSTSQQRADSADDSTTTTSPATGPPAAADAPVYVAPGNDPTPRLTTAGRSSAVAARPAVATAPSRPTARPVSARGGSVFPNPGPGPNVFAVVIGIQVYQGNTHHTIGGEGDAAAFMDLLNRNGWPASHIVELVDGDATAANIRGAMQWLASHSSPTSFSLFHYSGHVCQSDTGPCGAGHYLWSVDNRMIAASEFGNVMRGIQGPAWVDIAGCEGADFEQGISSGQRLFTASSQANEKSYEDPSWGESVWTGLMVDQGMLQGRADTNNDHRVSVQEAARWAQQQAPQMTTGQAHSPQHPFIGPGGNGDWYLAAANPTNQPPPPPAPGNGGGGTGGGSSPPPAPPPNRCGALTSGLVKC